MRREGRSERHETVNRRLVRRAYSCKLGGAAEIIRDYVVMMMIVSCKVFAFWSIRACVRVCVRCDCQGTVLEENSR